MPWIELGEWAFDMDDVAAVHRHPEPAGNRGEGVRTVTDVYLDSGVVITLEADDAAEFLERWAAPPGGVRVPLGRSYAVDERTLAGQDVTEPPPGLRAFPEPAGRYRGV